MPNPIKMRLADLDDNLVLLDGHVGPDNVSLDLSSASGVFAQADVGVGIAVQANGLAL